MQVSNTMNTVGISSKALFGITSLNRNLSLDAKLLSTLYLLWWLHFCFCLCKNCV